MTATSVSRENVGFFTPAKLFEQPHFGIASDECRRGAGDLDVLQTRHFPIEFQGSVISIQPAKNAREPHQRCRSHGAIGRSCQTAIRVGRLRQRMPLKLVDLRRREERLRWLGLRGKDGIEDQDRRRYRLNRPLVEHQDQSA